MAEFRFDFRRYARRERWLGDGYDIGRDRATEAKVSVVAENETAARAKLEALSGVYSGPASDLFWQGTSTNHGWIVELDTVTEEPACGRFP